MASDEIALKFIREMSIRPCPHWCANDCLACRAKAWLHEANPKPFPTPRTCARCGHRSTAAYTRKNVISNTHDSAYLCGKCALPWLLEGNHA